MVKVIDEVVLVNCCQATLNAGEYLDVAIDVINRATRLDMTDTFWAPSTDHGGWHVAVEKSIWYGNGR